MKLSLFMVVPEADSATADAFEEACASYEVAPILAYTDEPLRQDRRVWNLERYQRMAEVRNQMLDAVRLMQPTWFLSCDSDILIGRDVLAKLQVGLDTYDAIGGKVWLSPNSRDIVNYAKLNRSRNLVRKDHVGVIDVHVLMALKLMNPDAYRVDYVADPQGEDIGWSNNAREAGCRLGWDGTAVSKHCMSVSDLHRIDERVGW
jgi:hypothetical protein